MPSSTCALFLDSLLFWFVNGGSKRTRNLWGFCAWALLCIRQKKICRCLEGVVSEQIWKWYQKVHELAKSLVRRAFKAQLAHQFLRSVCFGCGQHELFVSVSPQAWRIIPNPCMWGVWHKCNIPWVTSFAEERKNHSSWMPCLPFFLEPSYLQLDTNTYRNSSISICPPLPLLVKYHPLFFVSYSVYFVFPCSLTISCKQNMTFSIWRFPKMGWYPQIIHFNRVFHYKPSILGYPDFWKHPFVMTVSLGSEWTMAMTIHVSLLSGNSASLRAPWAA